MSPKIHWYLPGRILLIEALSASREALMERNRTLLDYIDREGQPPAVHVLVDYRHAQSENFPVTIKDYLNAERLQQDKARQALTQHPLLGWVISIAAPHIIVQLGANLLAQKGHYHWQHVATLAEALGFLKAQDSTLRDLLSAEDDLQPPFLGI